MNGGSMLLGFLTTTAAVLLSLGAALPQSEAEAVQDEHLFIAGNDHTGTAAITYTSRLNPHATIARFDNFSFPDSCASHLSRCRSLKYMHPSTSSNYATLFFYVPLAELALGVVQFSYDSTTLHHVRTRTVALTRGRCLPISIVEVLRTFYLICISDRQRIMSCEIRNAEDINNVQLSCSTPGVPIDVSRLSNFVVYDEFRNRDLYFTNSNVIYRKSLTYGSVEAVSLLPSIYSHCRYLERINSPTPLIACYCYLHSNVDRIQVEYFDLDTYTFVRQQRTSAVVRYDCPSSGMYVEVPITGSYADFWHESVYEGSFNIIGGSVTFGRCFKYENATHFIYQDKQRGTFIKPNISVDLMSRIVQLSKRPCRSVACEHPYVFDSQYILLLLENPSVRSWKLKLLNISQDLLLTLDVTHPAQLALISDFVTHRRPDPPITTTTANAPSTPSVDKSNSKSATVIGTSTSCGLLVLLVLSAVFAVFVIVYYQSRHKGLSHRQGTYSPVSARSQNPSRQGSPTPEAIELKPLSPSKNETSSNKEQRSLLSHKEAAENREARNGDDVISDGSVSSSNAGKQCDNPLDRENYTLVGSSREDVRGFQQGTQPLRQGVTTTVSGSSTRQQQPDSVHPPRTETSNVSATAGTCVNSAVPLHSQHSEGGRDDHVTNPSGSVTSPMCTPLSQGTGAQPTSLAVHSSTHPQQNQTTILASTPTTADYTYGVPAHTQAHQCHQPMRSQSNDSTTSGVSSHSEGVHNVYNVSSSPSVLEALSGSQLSVTQNGSLLGMGLPLNRREYSGVGASQEDVLRPKQCTQLPGQPSQTTAHTTTARGRMSDNRSRVPYHSQHSDPSSTRSRRTSSSNDSTVPTLYSQHSDDSETSTRSGFPDNSRTVSASTVTQRRPLSLTSSPLNMFQHDNQATGTGPGCSPTYNNNRCFSGQNRRIRLRSVDSDTSQSSYLGINHLSTPTEHDEQSTASPTFFSSVGDGIVPPASITMSATQNHRGVST